MPSSLDWKGLMPAMTSRFDSKIAVDHGFLADHARWLVRNGCRAVIVLGSLGEGSTLDRLEKLAILANCASALEGSAPVVASMSALSTRKPSPSHARRRRAEPPVS